MAYSANLTRLGHGIFSADGKQWEHSRSLLRPQFARDQVSGLDLEENHLQKMLKGLPISADGWTTTTDVQTLFFLLTIDSASEFLVGESVNTQLNALPEHGAGLNDVEDAAFVNAFESSQDMIARAFRLNDWYSLGLTKEYYEACKVCHDYINKFVGKVLNNEKRTLLKPDGKEKYVFLEALAAETSNPIEIRDQLLSILVAGRDTTASLLSFLWLLLSQEPKIFHKLRAKVIDDFGTFNSPKTITFA